MSAELDLDDVAAAHPRALAELAKLRDAMRHQEMAHADAWALVLAHEGRIEQLTAAWRAERDTLTHQVIACGVAATHPDANLTRTGAYAEKWDSAQAGQVRALRAERDKLRSALTDVLEVATSWSLFQTTTIDRRPSSTALRLKAAEAVLRREATA